MSRQRKQAKRSSQHQEKSPGTKALVKRCTTKNFRFT
jgi:hypothetical protein